MSTHNIGFYEEISKIITYLSSNIIKYAPYFLELLRWVFDDSYWIILPTSPQNYVFKFVH